MIDKAFATRRYLAVFLPLLPAERVLTSGCVPHDLPFALVEHAKGGMCIAAVDAGALALGILPGLTLVDARALVPELTTINHQPAADAAFLDWIADVCCRYSPSVATDPPQGLVLDITGCVHPYGSEAELTTDLKCRLQRRGLTARLACAVTPDAALALARYQCDDVMTLPVGALRIDDETRLSLKRAGLKTVGALAAQPRAPLAARYGTTLTTLLARLLGEVDIHIVPRCQPAAVQFEMRFAEPVARIADMLGALDQLMGEAAGELAVRRCGGRRFEAALFRSDGHVARLSVETSTPTRDPKVVARLFGERIEALADPLDPDFGYDLIRLAVPVIEPIMVHQLRLDGEAVADTELAALLDRLTTRLGSNRVRRLVEGDSHIPEQAAFELAVGEIAPMAAWHAPDPGEPPLRPLQLFDPPQRIEVVAEVPDGPPRRFRWRQRLHEVTRCEGPERIAAQWWRRRDGKGLTRDYYRVEDTRGGRFWLFRHGLYGAEKSSPDWYIHGLFA